MSPLRRELKQTRAFSSLEQETFLNLQRTVSVISAEFDRLLKSHALSQTLYNVLRILKGQEALGPDNQGLPSSHIGDRMVARVPDVTRLVDKLITMGLARRKRSTTDRRVVLITITPEGVQVLASLAAPIAKLEKDSLSHLTAQELKALNELLVKARQSE